LDVGLQDEDEYDQICGTDMASMLRDYPVQIFEHYFGPERIDDPIDSRLLE
jgi:hypothetical protein